MSRRIKYFIFGGTEEGLPDEVPSKIKYLTTRRSFRQGSIALWVFSDKEGLSRREGKYPKGYTEEEKYRRGADVELCNLGTGCCELAVIFALNHTKNKINIFIYLFILNTWINKKILKKNNFWNLKFQNFKFQKWPAMHIRKKLCTIYWSTSFLQWQPSIDQRSNTLLFTHELLITYVEMYQLKIKSIFLF